MKYEYIDIDARDYDELSRYATRTSLNTSILAILLKSNNIKYDQFIKKQSEDIIKGQSLMYKYNISQNDIFYLTHNGRLLI